MTFVEAKTVRTSPRNCCLLTAQFWHTVPSYWLDKQYHILDSMSGVKWKGGDWHYDQL